MRFKSLALAGAALMTLGLSVPAHAQTEIQ